MSAYCMVFRCDLALGKEGRILASSLSTEVAMTLRGLPIEFAERAESRLDRDLWPRHVRHIR